MSKRLANKPGIIQRVKDFLKKHKLISKGLSHLAELDSLKNYSGHLKTASVAADALGYGRRRRKRRSGSGKKKQGRPSKAALAARKYRNKLKRLGKKRLGSRRK